MINITPSSPGMIQHGFSPTAIETFPAGGNIPFGSAVMLGDGGAVIEGTNDTIIGFAVVSHLACGPNGYRKGDPVGVLTQGTITTKGDGAIKLNSRLNFHGSKKAVLETTGGGQAPKFLTIIAKTAASATGLVDVSVQTTK